MYKIYINIVKITDILCNSAAAALLFCISFSQILSESQKCPSCLISVSASGFYIDI